METNKILTADYLDILFEGRNKSYGSYKMRKQYRRSVFTAAAISILITGGLFISLFFKPTPKLVEEMVHPTARISDIQPPPIDKEKLIIPPPPVPPPMLKSAHKLTPPLVKKNEDVKEVDQPKEIKKEDNTDFGLANIKGSDDPAGITPSLSDVSGNGTEPVVDATPKKDIIYKNVEQKPEFDGDINKYLASHIIYPVSAIVENIQGNVTVSFILDEKGNVRDARIDRDIGGGCGAEAIRVVSKMKWKKPAIQNGHPVKMYFVLNVGFYLR